MKKTINTYKPLVWLGMIGLLFVQTISAQSMQRYNVVWESPSVDPTGQMPLGNGDIGAGVYAIENDALYLLLSKNDAFTYVGDLFKTGRVKIALSPNPFEKGKSFKQTLDLDTGSIHIEADDVKIKVWADANRPVYHIEIEAPQKIAVSAEAETWERMDAISKNLSKDPIKPATQDVVLTRDNHIICYFAVGDRSTHEDELRFYDVPHMINKTKDPYRYNTFGNLIESPELTLKGKVLKGTGKRFDIRIHSLAKQEPDIKKWLNDLEALAQKPVNITKDWKAHHQWWSDFWKRSWIHINDNKIATEHRGQLDHEGYKTKRSVKDNGALVAQSYNVFRYIMASQSRGRIQAKFNGGLFSQPLRIFPSPKKKDKASTDKPIDSSKFKIGHEDDRLWGRRFTFMNQRLIYWPLLKSGDHDLMDPFYNYYANLLPVRREICKAWFGHEGAYFRENMCMSGGDRDCGNPKDPRLYKPLKTPPGGNEGNGRAHAYYFTSGLETVAMMIERVKFTGDQTFLNETLVPVAREILMFYDKHYPREASGMIRLDPSQACESWNIAVNPATDISGLRFNLDELIAMDAGTAEDKANWKRLRKEIPEVSLHEVKGKLAIAPGMIFEHPHNRENPALYAIFPFRQFGIGFGNNDIAKWSVKHRRKENSFDYSGWSQDQINLALVGNAEEAQHGLIQRFTVTSPMARFPLYGKQKPDSCPDWDHFGSGSIALQRMLIQEAKGKIYLLPAWPKDWDANFKLHASGNTVIEGKVKDGKFTLVSVSPESRRKDIINNFN